MANLQQRIRAELERREAAKLKAERDAAGRESQKAWNRMAREDRAHERKVKAQENEWGDADLELEDLREVKDWDREAN